MSNSEQWEFFKRIEDLEKTTKELEITEATARENRTILFITFYLAFAAVFNAIPHEARAGKDQIILTLKRI
jgi:hypothetical protein